MNAEELKTEFGLEFPTEIDGYKRPGALENGHDWFLEIPQIIAKDKVLYTGMNLILSALLSNEKLLKQWHDTLQNVVNAQDWRVVTDSLKGYMTPELKKKLDGIAMGANNYVHPSSHPASMIAQDATHRFVSDTEKNTWNAKASTSLVSTTANGLMPKRDGSATSIFTGDGVWKSLAWNLITGKPSTFAPSAHNHDGSYLKLSGGSLTGALNLANDIWNKIGDDVYIGDSNQAGCLCIKGVNADSGIAFVNKDNTVQIAKLTYAGGNLISSVTIQGNITGNAGTATKAIQDGNGSTISTTYLNRNWGGIPSSNFNNAYTEGLYTWRNTEANRPFDWGRLLTLNTGYNATNSWIWQLAFPTRNGNLKLRTNTNGEGWLGWRTIPFTDSPAFSGTPTSPTPATSDNSTKIATTEFVRNLINQFKTDGTLGGIVGGSLSQNGWVKFSNGLILQWR